MGTAIEPVFLTPPEVGRRLRVSPERVIGWLLSGELHGVDVSSKDSKRPRYRISEVDLQTFLDRRSANVNASPPRHSRKSSGRTYY